MKRPIAKLTSLASLALATTALLLLSTACATKGFVRKEVEATNARVTGVESQVEQAQDQLAEHDQKLADQERRIGAVNVAASDASKTAQEALDRALEAGKLAEGKLLYETVLSEDRVRFGFDRAELSDEARSALSEFVAGLKSADENVYIEIQGHTDSIGTEQYNIDLGTARAEAVRRELNALGLPLHRLSVISYGEAAPLTDNGTREGRSRNRRVVLVVLK